MNIFLNLFILTLTTICYTKGQLQSPQSNENVTVKVSQGYLQGKKVTSTRTGGTFYSFHGIPYAQPPVGELRFKAPTEASSWTGVRDATFQRSICLQLNETVMQGSDDCLYLNVYSPQLPSASVRNHLPVMVWIPGGGFITGSGNIELYSPDYLVNKGVLLVTMNYRLGVLGFLGLNNSLVSQNNGLKDQLAALKWVRANIAQFGGDKDQVTIFGDSAGGACVELQVLSPATKDLFHRAISQSGNAVNRWAYVEPSLAKERAFRLGKYLGFTGDDEAGLITFLKETPAEKLIAFQGNATTPEDVLRSINIPFQPTKESGEDIFLPESPLNIMKSGNYQHVPYITGITSTEAKFFELDYLHNDSLWKELANDMEQFVPPELGLPLGSSESLLLASEIKEVYFGNDTPTVKNIEGLVNVFSDSFFVSGLRRSAKFRLNTNAAAPVYVYQFSYVGRLSISQNAHYDYPFRGAGHADDLGYLFYLDNVQLENNATEMSVLHQMTTMWTNFAKTGNPAERLDIKWDSLTPSKKTYLDIDTELSVRLLDDLHAKRMALWDKIFARIDDN